MAGLGRHRAEGYDYCDSTHCLLYQGEESVSSEVRREVAAGSTQVLVRAGQVIPAPLTACCGGTLLPEGWLWPGAGAASGGTSRSCPWCRGSRDAVWQRKIGWDDFSGRVEQAFGLTGLADIRSIPGSSGESGPVVELRGSGGTVRLPVEEFRIGYGRRHGWNFFRSNLFTFRRAGGTLEVDGRGFGHCAGLCLAGATAMARRGMSAREILAFYFPEAALVSADTIRSASSGW